MHSKIIDIDWSFIAIVELLATKSFNTVLDVGSGSGSHSEIFRLAGKNVTSLDKYVESADVRADLLDYWPETKFDCIFCSHVVEHQRNVGTFLDKIRSLLSDDGFLCITGPCHSPDQIFEGHLMTWTAVTAIQSLVLAGFDCSNAVMYQFYETGVICQKAKTFDVVSVGYKFDNLNAWPVPPKNGQYLIGSNGVFSKNIHHASSYTFGESSVPKLHPLQVKNSTAAYDFYVTSKGFTQEIVHFINP